MSDKTNKFGKHIIGYEWIVDTCIQLSYDDEDTIYNIDGSSTVAKLYYISKQIFNDNGDIILTEVAYTIYEQEAKEMFNCFVKDASNNYLAKNEKRIKMLKAMEYIARSTNNEELFMLWLYAGVPDGDIKYGDLRVSKDDLRLLDYTDDETFANIMHCFLKLMHNIFEDDSGLYCDDVLSKGWEDA